MVEEKLRLDFQNTGENVLNFFPCTAWRVVCVFLNP